MSKKFLNDFKWIELVSHSSQNLTRASNMIKNSETISGTKDSKKKIE